jgi:hypothetical protein
MILGVSLNGINQLLFVMANYGVLFGVRTDLLIIIKTSVGFQRVKPNLQVFPLDTVFQVAYMTRNK